MKKTNYKQIIGGVAVSLGVFFLLIMAYQLKNMESASTSLISDENLAKPLNVNGELKNPSSPGNVVHGAFNVEGKGQIVRYDPNNPERKFHYKAIINERFKKQDQEFSLKLETEENNKKTWKAVQWSWIDYDQGLMYFHFKTEENETENLVDSYTGNFEILFP